MNEQPAQSKAGKRQKTLYLSSHARQLLAVLALGMGVSQSDVIELVIREKAAREQIVLRKEDASGAAVLQQRPGEPPNQ